MSVYLKLQQAREELSNMNLKKTGENKFSKYKYYELGDILPAITKLSNKFKICSVVKFTEELAELIVVDSEKPESYITFTSSVAAAEMKGVQAIQRLGAEQTYLRRYLYMNAFEIVEADVIDETNNSNEEKKAPVKKSTLSDAQLKRLFAITKSACKSSEEVKAIMKEKFNKDSSKDLTKAEYDELCEELEGK